MTKKQTITRKDALTTAVEIMREYVGINFTDGDVAATHTENAIAVLENMIVQIDRQAAKPKGKTSARVQNEQYAIAFCNMLETLTEPVSARWISEHVRGVMSVSRAVWVAKIAEEWGAIEKVTIKNRTLYQAVNGFAGVPENAGRTA